MRFLPAVLLLILASGAAAQPGPCVCESPPLPRRIARADALFVGRITAKGPPGYPLELQRLRDFLFPTLGDSWADRLAPWASFDLVEPLKGLLPYETLVATSPERCPARLEPGAVQVVFASRDEDGRLQVDACSTWAVDGGPSALADTVARLRRASPTSTGAPADRDWGLPDRVVMRHAERTGTPIEILAGQEFQVSRGTTLAVRRILAPLGDAEIEFDGRLVRASAGQEFQKTIRGRRHVFTLLDVGARSCVFRVVIKAGDF